MKLEQLVEEKKEEIKRVAEKHGAYNIRLFGSVARGESTPESDIDFLIDAGEETSSWFPAGLIIDLEDLLGCKVHVVEQEALIPGIREHALNEAIPL